MKMENTFLINLLHVCQQYGNFFAFLAYNVSIKKSGFLFRYFNYLMQENYVRKQDFDYYKFQIKFVTSPGVVLFPSENLRISFK